MSAFSNAPRRLRWTFALAVAAAAGVTTPAPAQFGLTGGFNDAFRPGFIHRDVQVAVDMLQLDELQRDILQTRFEDYQADFDTGIAGFRQSIANLRDEIDPTQTTDQGKILRIVFGAMDAWKQEARALLDQFMADLKNLLNEEQLERWPAFERRLFRLKYLVNGRLSGESLDLVTAVQELDLEPAQYEPIQHLMLEYELQLHEALREREEYIAKSQEDLFTSIQERNPGLGIETAARQVELRAAVRDINEHYAAAVADALPSEIGERFLANIRERAHPRIFRPTQVQRIFEAAEKIQGLDESTLSAIKSLHQEYLAELRIYNERILQVTRDYQPRELQNKVEAAATRMAGGAASKIDDPLREQYAKRREMGSRYVEQLKSLLTPEQFAALPGANRWLDAEERQALIGRDPASIKKGASFTGGSGGSRRAVAPTAPRGGGGESEDDGS